MKSVIRLLCGCAVLVGPGCSRRSEPDQRALPPQRPAIAGEVVLAADSPKLSRIKVANVEQAEVALNEVVAPGVIEVNPNRMAQVLMPVAGRVKQVLARLGDSVKQGQQLVSIESPEVGAAISAYRQAEAAVTQARATAGKAEADLARVSDLYAHRAIAQKEVLNAENMLSQARTELEQKRAARDEALRRLEILGLRPGEFSQDIAVRAPISGKVVEIRVVAGEYRNDTSTPLLRIADLGTVWVAADVPEALIRFISLGERIEVELPAYPGEVFPGRVTRIADSADPQTRSIKVRAEMSNPAGRFRPEMFARIRHLQNVRTLPVVPPGAVIQGEGRAIVYLERAPGVFLEREVELGPRNGDRMPVLSGLKPGDRIVVDGAMLLRTS